MQSQCNLAYIYALADPDTDDVRYIGLTHLLPVARYRQHMSLSRNPLRQIQHPLYAWLAHLTATHKTATLRILRVAPHGQGQAAEKLEIAIYRRTGLLLNLKRAETGGSGKGPRRPRQLPLRASETWEHIPHDRHIEIVYPPVTPKIQRSPQPPKEPKPPRESREARPQRTSPTISAIAASTTPLTDAERRIILNRIRGGV